MAAALVRATFPILSCCETCCQCAGWNGRDKPRDKDPADTIRSTNNARRSPASSGHTSIKLKINYPWRLSRLPAFGACPQTFYFPCLGYCDGCSDGPLTTTNSAASALKEQPSAARRVRAAFRGGSARAGARAHPSQRIALGRRRRASRFAADSRRGGCSARRTTSSRLPVRSRSSHPHAGRSRRAARGRS